MNGKGKTKPGPDSDWQQSKARAGKWAEWDVGEGEECSSKCSEHLPKPLGKLDGLLSFGNELRALGEDSLIL